MIARPFIGEPGNFTRTANRHDYSLQPPEKTVLDLLKDEGLEVIGVGKIKDILLTGLTKHYPISNNMENR